MKSIRRFVSVSVAGVLSIFVSVWISAFGKGAEQFRGTIDKVRTSRLYDQGYAFVGHVNVHGVPPKPVVPDNNNSDSESDTGDQSSSIFDDDSSDSNEFDSNLPSSDFPSSPGSHDINTDDNSSNDNENMKKNIFYDCDFYENAFAPNVLIVHDWLKR